VNNAAHLLLDANLKIDIRKYVWKRPNAPKRLALIREDLVEAASSTYLLSNTAIP
jgi:hypothetical protein